MAGVLKFSEAASIAIHGMILMAVSPGSPVTGAEIADSFGISENHTRKVMQRLVKAGLARSVRGPSGGYSVLGDTSTITLLAVYEAMDGRIGEDRCLFQRSRCPAEGCLLKGLLEEVDSVVRRHLSGTTLSDFTKKRLGRTG
jgi:Rrf2 family protein